MDKWPQIKIGFRMFFFFIWERVLFDKVKFSCSGESKGRTSKLITPFFRFLWREWLSLSGISLWFIASHWPYIFFWLLEVQTHSRKLKIGCYDVKNGIPHHRRNTVRDTLTQPKTETVSQQINIQKNHSNCMQCTRNLQWCSRYFSIRIHAKMKVIETLVRTWQIIYSVVA